MPNRILRDWTDSFTINSLDAHAERFFTRLIMKVDDFGAFHADTRLLKSYLFPLLPDIRETDITRWLAACEKAGLVRCYVDGKSRKYLQILNFKQRMRQQVAKFPQPEGNQIPADNSETDDVLPDDGQLTDDCPPNDGDLPPEVEEKPNTNTKGKKVSSAKKQKAPPDPRSSHPAILTCKSLMSRYPDKSLYDQLIQVIGDEPNEEQLKLCRQEWVKRGFNPSAWTWALDWYRDGIPQNGNGHSSRFGNKAEQLARQNDAAGDAWLNGAGSQGQNYIDAETLTQ